MIEQYSFAPVVLFAYKRSDALRRVLAALEQCPEFSRTQLFIRIDGPKNENDIEKIYGVTQVAQEFAARCTNTNILTQQKNLGLVSSIRKGVSEICADAGRVIVLEEDIVVSPAFLRYMNSALEYYSNAERVMSVNAYTYGKLRGMPVGQVGFMPFAHPWGWATWQRCWDPFTAFWDANEFKFATPMEARAFDLGGIEAFADMLSAAESGKISSWWILWYFFLFKSKGLGVFPPQTLVNNIGIMNDPTHQSWSARLLEGSQRSVLQHSPTLLPPDIETVDFRNAYIKAMKPFTRKILRHISRIRAKVERVVQD